MAVSKDITFPRFTVSRLISLLVMLVPWLNWSGLESVDSDLCFIEELFLNN